jgi:hypothetical protein
MGVIMPLLFALAMLGVLSFVLSDVGTQIVQQIIANLRQAQLRSMGGNPSTAQAPAYYLASR